MSMTMRGGRDLGHVAGPAGGLGPADSATPPAAASGSRDHGCLLIPGALPRDRGFCPRP
jgi:hypothetical protein